MGERHRLLLIRHAKTEQGFPDEVRQLTDQGRADAAAIGRWLGANDAVPDAVVVSPARRARQTWQIAAEALTSDIPSTVDDRIYDNSVDNLLAIAREADESVTTLAIVGHNPSIEQFAARYGGSVGVSTGSVVVFDVAGSWDGDIRFAAAETCRG